MTDAERDAPTLLEVVVADPTEPWTAAGFRVGADDTVCLGAVAVRLVGRGDQRPGIVGWALSGVDVPDGHLDGLPTRTGATASSTDPTGKVDPGGRPPTPRDSATGAGADPTPSVHPNGATGIDHVVVSTPDLDRTIAACEAAGLPCRRIREAGTPDRPMRQAFFRLGPVVLEVVGGAAGSGTTADDDPARWFGLALNVADLEHSAVLLGPGLGRVKTAVQAGRRIATVRHRDLDLSVSLALMDDHGDR
jgi:hypothetical protein